LLLTNHSFLLAALHRYLPKGAIRSADAKPSELKPTLALNYKCNSAQILSFNSRVDVDLITGVDTELEC
jgi:hypothetical protein